MRRALRCAAIVSAALVLSGCTAIDPWSSKPEASFFVTDIEAVSVDDMPFVQGLEIDDESGDVFVSTGLYGQSEIQRRDGASFEVLERAALPQDDFGEGLTVFDDAVLQLTWREQTAYSWTSEDLTSIGAHAYAGEGWGLCYDDVRDVLWRSDGSDELIMHDSVTWEERGRVSTGIEDLNELECIDGHVWANVFLQDIAVRIDPEQSDRPRVLYLGEVLERERELRKEMGVQELEHNEVLNGLAWDQGSCRMLVSGKGFSHWYRVSVTEGAGVAGC